MDKVIIPLDAAVENSESGLPCGGCQWLGVNPIMNAHGVCLWCDRTREQIIKAHGKCELSNKEKDERLAQPNHMVGVTQVYKYESRSPKKRRKQHNVKDLTNIAGELEKAFIGVYMDIHVSQVRELPEIAQEIWKLGQAAADRRKNHEN